MGVITSNGELPEDGENRKLVNNNDNMYPPFCHQIDENYVPEGDIEYPFEDIGGSGDENKIRGNWSAGVDYYLAVFGFTFGLGNVWRFPYQLAMNGGVTYLIPYFAMFFLTSLPILFMELSIGQFISLGAVSVWKVAPMFKGIGISMVLISSILAIYYNMITSWAIFYFVNSIKFSLPWTTCGNHWNSESCTVWNRGAVANCKNLNGTMLINGTCLFEVGPAEDLNVSKTVIFPSNGVLPSTEYFHNEVLMMSSGLIDFQTVNWQLAICLLIAWSAVFLGSFKGIKTSGKVIYISVILPYIILFVLLVRFVTLPGSVEGLLHFLKPDWSVLQDFHVWGEAAVQVFYSLSTCTGGLIVLSSYNRFHSNVFGDVLFFAAVDLVTSFFMTCLLFSAAGFVCYELDLPIDQFHLQDGVQLIFIFFSDAISKLPVAPLYSAIFFGMIALVIYNSELFIVETIVSSICDEFPERLRTNHRHVLTFVVLLFYILGLPLCSAAGIFWIFLLEAFVATWPLIIIAFLECMVISWIYGVDNFMDNIKWMTGYYPPFYIFWRLLWKFICPMTFMAILAFVWLEYKPIHYEAVVFPLWAHIGGWCVSLSPIIITFVVIVYQLITTPGSFCRRWRDLLFPEEDWGPALAIHRAEKYPLQIPEARKLLLPNSYVIHCKLPTVEPPNQTPESIRRRSVRETTVQSIRDHGNERETII